MEIYTRGNVVSSPMCLRMDVKVFSCHRLPADHRVKEKERDTKKNKEWKHHKLPPAHDITRENGEGASPQKGTDSHGTRTDGHSKLFLTIPLMTLNYV